LGHRQRVNVVIARREAKGEETPATRKTKSAQHILRQQRRTRSGVSDAPLTAAPAIAAADGTQSQK